MQVREATVATSNITRAIALHVQARQAGHHVLNKGAIGVRGSELIFRANYIPEVGTDGSVTGFYAMTLDITNMKGSEEQLRLIKDNLRVPIAHLDVEQRFQFCHAAFKQWRGVDPAALVGKTMHCEMTCVTLDVPHVLQTVYVPRHAADHYHLGVTHKNL